MENLQMTDTISTGEPNTLATYRKIALALSGGNKDAKVVKFFDEKIATDRDGENARVIAHETQVMYLIITMLGE